MTAILTFSRNHGIIEIIDPGATTTVTLAGKSLPIAADLTAPEALLIAETHPEKFPYWHSYVHRSPEGIAEVERILLNR